MITGKLTTGRNLWWVPRDGHRGCCRAVTVTKVGRTWAALSNNYRADIATGAVDGKGYVSPAELFDSEDAYRDYVSMVREFHLLRTRFPYTPPPGVTLDDVKAAAKLLGVDG